LGVAPVTPGPGAATVLRLVVLDGTQRHLRGTQRHLRGTQRHLRGTQRHLRVATWPPGPPWMGVAHPAGVGSRGRSERSPIRTTPAAPSSSSKGADRHLWVVRLRDAASSWADQGGLPGAGRVRGRAGQAGIISRFPSWKVYAVAAVCADGRLVVGPG
jgi:hypothetical protein